MALLSREDRSDWSAPVSYERHRPETTLLYQLIQEHWPRFQAELGSQGKRLPKFVAQEFEEYLKCGRLEYGFLRVRCESCHHEKLTSAAPSTSVVKNAAFAPVAGLDVWPTVLPTLSMKYCQRNQFDNGY